VIETHEHAGDFQRAMSEVGQIPLRSGV